MFQTPILDVSAGLILFFLILSLVCTSLNEIVAQMLSLRQEFLWRALCSLFQNSTDQKAELIAREILDHNLVDAMSPPGANPSNIPSHVFSLAVLDVIGLSGAESTLSVGAQLEAAKIVNQTNLGSNIFDTLKPLAVAAGTSVDLFRQNIEHWFDATMDRANDWYKRRLRVITFCVAFAICILLNADTLMLAKALWTSPQAAAKLASTAQTVSNLKPPSDVSAKNKDLNVGSGDTINNPAEAKLLPPELQSARSEVFGLIGWSGRFAGQEGYNRSNEHRYPADGWEGLLKLFGLLVTTFAACLGAPFWFDAIKKIVAIRNASTSNSANNPPRISSEAKKQGDNP